MINKRLLVLTSYLQLFFLFITTSRSYGAVEFELDSGSSAKGQAEFFNSNRSKRMLIKINLVSGVRRPGIHYVPDDTNLIDLISLAGGVTSDAEPDDISIRREGINGVENLSIDLNEIMRNSDLKVPLLANNDSLFIPESTGFRQNLMLQLAMITAVVGLLSMSLGVYNTLNR